MPDEAPVTNATSPAREKEGRSIIALAPAKSVPPPLHGGGGAHGAAEGAPPPPCFAWFPSPAMAGEDLEATLAGLLRTLAQRVFLDLAGRGFRQRAEHDSLRRFVVRHVGAAEGGDVGRRDRLGRLLQRDEGARRLAPFVVRPGDDGRLHDRRVAVKHLL